MEFQGLTEFFKWMDKTFGERWVLVGGAAAWAYIAGAERKMNEGLEVYKRIFPDDIDVMISGDKPKEVITVRIGDLGVKEVDFVEDFQDAEAKCVGATKLQSGARVLTIDEIIFKYSTTSKKPKVRQTRVAILEAIKKGEIISPTEMQKFYDSVPTKPVNPFANALAGLRKTNK